MPHDLDDVMLQQILDAAEDEALRFMNLDDLTDSLSESSDTIAPSITEGIFLLCMASYGAPTASEIIAFRKAAELKLFPYRTGLGV